MKKIIYPALFLCFLLADEVLSAQQHDYPAYPKKDFSIEHLEASLEINELVQVRGEVSYNIRFTIDVSDSLQLDAKRMVIDDVRVNERTMDYEFIDEKLTIFLDEDFSRNDTATLRVIYSAEPRFGVLSNHRGTIFSSQMPLSTSHWLPAPDHPGMVTSTDITVTHPSALKLVMTGNELSNQVVSVDQEQTRFESRYPVPVTSLFFAIGAFQAESRTIDNVRYHVHSEQPNGTIFEEYELQNIASQAVQRMEELTGVEYPLGDIHIVLVNDLVWETRTYAAGTVLADLNHSLENQIKYGIAGQWAGVMLREMQWIDPAAIELLMGYFAEALEIQPAGRDTMQDWDGLYKAASLDNIEQYRHYIRESDELKALLPAIFSILFEKRENPYAWEDIARIIYRNSGQPFFDRPEFVMPEPETEQVYEYSVSLDHIEGEGEVIVRFEALGEPLDDLVSVQVRQFTFNETRDSELTFTGATDEIVLSVPADIENILLTVEERDDLILDVKKPFMFWIYQLREGENANQRKEAASGLRQYADNPDLQLALLDMIEMESDPGVYAEIIRTLSYVTDGASGTSQIYLDRMGSGQPDTVRTEAVRALAFYGGNDTVISRLQSLIRSAEKENLRREAIHSLAAVTDLDRFTNITESMIVQDAVLYEIPLFLDYLAAKGGEERVVRMADNFLSSEFPYNVRSGALKQILELDRSQQGWEARIDALMEDGDPRIRYITTDGIQYLSNEKRNQVLEIYSAEEFDERVFRKIQSVR